MIIFAFSAARLSQIVPKSFCRTPLIFERTLTVLYRQPVEPAKKRKEKVKRLSIKGQWKRHKIVSQTLKDFSLAILNGPPKVLLNLFWNWQFRDTIYLFPPCLRDNPFFWAQAVLFITHSDRSVFTLSSLQLWAAFNCALCIICLTSTVDFYSTYL